MRMRIDVDTPRISTSLAANSLSNAVPAMSTERSFVRSNTRGPSVDSHSSDNTWTCAALNPPSTTNRVVPSSAIRVILNNMLHPI